MDDRPGLIVQTPQHQPRGGETFPPVFVPAVASWDSPQRPAGWGTGLFHVPSVSVGTTTPESERTVDFRHDVWQYGKSFRDTEAYLDDGTPIDVSQLLQVNHSPEDRALYLRDFEVAPPTGTLAIPENSIRRNLNHDAIRTKTQDFEVLETRRRTTVTHIYSVRHPYNGGPQLREWVYDEEYGTELLVYRRTIPGEVQYRLVRTRSMMPSGLVQDNLWIQGRLADIPIAGRRVTLDELNAANDGTRNHQYALFLYESVYYITDSYQEEGQVYTYTKTRGSVWPDTNLVLLSTNERLPEEGENLPPVVDGWTDRYEAAPVVVTELERGDTLYSIDDQWHGPRFKWERPTFIADQGRIQAYSNSITAYGHTFKPDPADANSTPSWTFLRDTPRRTTSGWDFSPLIVLVKQGQEVHAVRPDGSKETVRVADFERNVLRLKQGYMANFEHDATTNSWPPQWGWVRCAAPEAPGGYNSRAVAAHDPWRDNRKHPQAGLHPLEWDWKQRPNKRPRQTPATAPRSTLGLTLADVTTLYSGEEKGPRAAPPLRLPVTATVGGTDVRKAVAKRFLYQPANWPEELNDSTSAGSPLLLDFGPLPVPGADERLAAALLIRYRGPDQDITVNGLGVRLYRLGNNAAEDRGWHSYVLYVQPAQTYELRHLGRISRALLCVRVVSTLGGVQ